MTLLPSDFDCILRKHLETGPRNNMRSWIKYRSENRGGLLRLQLESNRSIVVKVWQLRSWKKRFKSTLGISNGNREWHVHRFLHQSKLPVPKPIFFKRISLSKVLQYEIMAIEDIGEPEAGVSYLKRLVGNGDNSKILLFEDRVIDITSKLLRLNIIDIDNQLNNFLINSSGNILRTDFECARMRRFFSIRRVEYAKMLDRLVRSHLHATHPNSEYTKQFMAKIANRLFVSKSILQMASEIIIKELKKEKQKSGTTYSLSFDW